LGFQTGSDNERIEELERQYDDIIDSQLNSVSGNDAVLIDATLGQRNDASGDAGGIRSNQPIIHNITQNDESGTPTGTFDRINLISSMIIVDHTSTPIDLRFIQGPAKDGAKIKITVKKDKSLVIKSGGNILTSSDITVNDTEFFILVKHSFAETGVIGGAYKILVGGSGGGGTSPPFPDSDVLIEGSVDPTKLMRFEIDGFATGVTRVMTLPDASVTLAGLGVISQTWTGTNIFVGQVAVRDNAFFIQDNADITKQLVYDLNGGATGQILTLASQITGNRVLTFPDSTTDLAGLGTVSQTWTGTNDFAGIVNVRDSNFTIQNVSDTSKEVKFDISAFGIGDSRTLSLPNSCTTLAGLGVVSQTWTGTNDFAGNVAVRDTNFFIQNTADITKQMLFDLAGATTGFTLTLESNHTGFRTLTFPNATTDLAGLGVVSQTWTGTNDFAGNVAVRDTNFFIENTVDITKQLKFDIAGATTGKVLTLDSNHTDNRTLTFPDSTTSLAGLGTLSQIWTGTNDFVGITTVIDVNFGIKDFSDNTKVAAFDASLISTSTTRTYSLPNSTTTLAGLGVVTQTWTGTNTFVGVTNFAGNVTIGDATSDTVTFNSRTISDIVPATNAMDDLGTAILRYNNGFFDFAVNIFESLSSGSQPSTIADTARIFGRDAGGGKMEVAIRFPSGNAVVIATEP